MQKEDIDSSSREEFFKEFYRRALKSISPNEIENMIAKVLGDASRVKKAGF